jgi:polyisoprenoid-binding protein YceI
VLKRFLPVVLVVTALLASLARWATQGSHNIYTAFAKRFYIPDPDLGWRISNQHPVWLGLEICAVLLATAIGLALLAVFVRRTFVLVGSYVIATLSLVVPIVAFASGAGPLGGKDTLPPSAAVKLEGGIEGALDAPAGDYAVVTHPGTAVTTHLSAGGEAFDARFGDVTGTWHGDPHALAQPMHAEISVATASVDTGVGERSKHAREKYLLAEQFPRIAVVISQVLAVRQTTANELAFRAAGSARFMGKLHAVEITGVMQRPDAAALQRLGLAGDVLLVQADFSLVIAETALASDAHDFDGDRFPIHVSLVLRRN